MNACKYLSPNTAALRHDGVENNPDFEFEGEFPFHVCLHPANQPDGSLGQCGFYLDNQHQCQISELYDDVTIARGTGDGHKIEFITALEGLHERKYRVVHNGELIVRLSVHEDADARDETRKVFDDLCAQHDADVEEFPEKDETTSYLKKVTTV